MDDKVVDTGWFNLESIPWGYQRDVTASVDGGCSAISMAVSTYDKGRLWIGLFVFDPADQGRTRVWDGWSRAADLEGAQEEIETRTEEWVGAASKALTLLSMSIKAKENPKP